MSPPVEDPAWNLLDVVGLALASVLILAVCLLGAALALRPRAVRSPGSTEGMAAVLVAGQVLGYGCIMAVMYALVRMRTTVPLLKAIRWNWPENWAIYLGAGFALAVCLVPLGRFLPMPKNLPIDDYFKNARDAYILSLFGVLVAPLFEELCFRGFLYPSLARRLGIPTAIVLTALPFAMLHGAQLSFSWGPLLVIFLVGIALTTVRALKKSVAATVLMHMAYNGTLLVAELIATDGFRHMDKFSK